jgi:hypothetical protein
MKHWVTSKWLHTVNKVSICEVLWRLICTREKKSVNIVFEQNQIVERGKIDITNTQTHDHSLSSHVTGKSIKRGGIKLILWAQTSSLSDVMWSCKCFTHINKMLIFTHNRRTALLCGITGDVCGFGLQGRHLFFAVFFGSLKSL